MSSINFKSKISILEKVGRKLIGSQLEKSYYQNFFKNIEYPQPTKGNILMYVGIGHMYLTPIEILMYHLLRKEGYDVEYLIYDENVPINEVITKERVEIQGKEAFWNNSVKNAKRVLDAAYVQYDFIQKHSEVDQIVQQAGNTAKELFNFEYEGIPVGNIVEGAMYRYYKSLTFGKDALEIARKYLTTTLTNYFFVKQKTTTKKYDYLFFSHGIYCTWQAVVDYCQHQNIPFVCYDRAKMRGGSNFNLNIPSPVWEMKEAWERLADYELSDAELKRVDDYIGERELQKGDVYAYNFAAKTKDLEALKEKLGVKKGSKIITIFTNLIWDAANVSRDIAFESPLDCIKKTIKKYANQDGIHILIRPHPAEQVLGTKERYDELIRAAFDHQLPSNATVIEHDWKVNSFSVLEMSDIGVVHTSTVGLEMAIEGKGTILISETHYRDRGFTFDATSEAHYFQLIDEIISGKLKIENQVALAKKYFYFMMFEYQHLMPMIFTDKGVFDGYGYYNFETLHQDENSSINKIIARISSGEPFEDFIFR